MSNKKQQNKRGTCDQCGKRRVIRYQNVVKNFCSAECANKYLESEGFHHRVVEDKS